MITHESKYRFWRTSLVMGEKKHFQHDKIKQEGYSQKGIYTGSEVTVTVDVLVNWITSQPNLVILNATHKGYNYQRNYGCTFSDHGLKLICARFVKDVLKGKIK